MNDKLTLNFYFVQTPHCRQKHSSKIDYLHNEGIQNKKVC